MLCKEIKEKLIDYIDGILDEKDHLAIENHIKHCTSCEEELKELRETISYIKETKKDIKAPHNLMENVKKEVTNAKKLYKKPRIKIGYIALVSILVTLLITTAFANENIRTILETWQGKSLKESQSIEELISKGYGEQVNLISEDKNIKVKVESVVADDINMVLLLEVENLNGDGKYVPILSKETIDYEGNFKFSSLIGGDSIRGSYLLYTPDENKTRTVVSLSPLASNEGEIELTIKALEPIHPEYKGILPGYHYYSKEIPENAIEGYWNFKIPVKVTEAHVFNLNEQMDLDGNKIIFEQLEISPTITTLTYRFNRRQNSEYALERLFNIKIEANGKNYESKSYGGDSSYWSNMGAVEGIVSFDSMYFEMPDKIKITVDGYDAIISKTSTMDVDVEKSFPQSFEYLDSNIRVNNVQGDKNLIRISMDNLGERYFEILNFRIFINGQEYKKSSVATKFLFPENENSVYESSYDILLSNLSKKFEESYPKEGYSVSRSYEKSSTYYENYNINDNATEKLELKDKLDDEIKSIKIIFNSYEETRYVEGSLSLKLKKYKQK
ncbi:DUF4179 domain-containing protein [Alkaliphilus sp. MSJ-5]|uniref:DUF4179 domain-containing protein n=1 Tax=Alkaliphilus flagellatus TaxID=2841507 RepID=A0ABS6FYA7_9FIRM|nr:DUF5643 domain-containing protein [Alkaliphilus flagellatus]MBU5675216.1 DUF4179 domain-containing protein [Alkaliphilus flagellatus]